MRLKESNVAEAEKQEEDWGKCFMAETATNAMTSINFDRDWIVDFGCSHHLTGDGSKFSLFCPCGGKDAIITTDNTVHAVKKEGTMVINNKKDDSITLNSVFHIPGMKKNLYSVANAVDAGNYLLFGPHDVKFLQNIKD